MHHLNVTIVLLDTVCSKGKVNNKQPAQNDFF